jgi:membrane fusion protein, multidrug efflux system
MMAIEQYSAHSILVRALAAGMLAAGALVVAFRFADAQTAAPAGTLAPAVITLMVHPQELTRSSEFIGRAQAIESVDVRAQVSGILQKVGFEGGQDVQQGALLYQIDPEQYQAAVSAAQAQLKSAQASQVQAQQNFQRQQELYQHQSTAQATLEQAQRDVAQANVLAAQAQLKTAQINLGFATINSPITGRVGATKVTTGNLVGPTTGTLTTVVQLDPIRVVFSVNERSLVAYKQHHPGATQEEINARFVPKLRLPDGTMFVQTGRVAFVDNQVDPNTGTVPVYADFPNPQRVLLPGMLITAVVSPESPPMGFLVPAGAVQQDAQGKFVLVVGNDNKVQRRNVTTGDQIEQSTAITAGLQDGDRVIVEGGQKVRPDQVVRATSEGTQQPARAPAPQQGAVAAPATRPSATTGSGRSGTTTR